MLTPDLIARQGYEVGASGMSVTSGDLTSSTITHVVITYVDCVGGNEIVLNPAVGDTITCQAGSNPMVKLAKGITLTTAGGNITVVWYEWGPFA